MRIKVHRVIPPHAQNTAALGLSGVSAPDRAERPGRHGETSCQAGFQEITTAYPLDPAGICPRRLHREPSPTCCEARHSLIANAWVEVRVCHIDEQIDKHDGRGNEEIHALYHGVVTLKGSVHQKAPHARQPEDGLDDHRTADHLDDLDTHHGHYRDDGVFDGVLQHH